MGINLPSSRHLSLITNCQNISDTENILGDNILYKNIISFGILHVLLQGHLHNDTFIYARPLLFQFLLLSAII